MLDRVTGEWRYRVRSFDLRRNITGDLEALLPEMGFEVLEVLRGCSFGLANHGTTNLL